MDELKYTNLQKRSDGTFVVDFNGLPFQVTPDYPKETQYGHEWTFEAISAYAGLHPDEVSDYQDPEIIASPTSRSEDIKMQMLSNDFKSVRAIRAVSSGTATDEDQELLSEIEAEQTALREELAGLSEL